MPEQFAGNTGDESQRHKDRKQHHGNRHNRRCDPIHGKLGRFRHRKLRVVFHGGFDIFHHHNRIIHHNANGKHHGEQGDRIGRIAHGIQHREGADQADRHRNQRNDGGADRTQEQEDHNHHQHKGFQQRLDHLMNRELDEKCGVIGHLIAKPRRKACGQLAHGGSNTFRHANRIGPGREENLHQQRGAAIQPRIHILVPGAKFQPRHIPHTQDAAIRIGADDDGAKFSRGDQPPRGGDIKLIGRILGHGLGANAPKRCHLILLLDRANHIRRRQAKRGQAIGLEPDAHGIIARAEHLRVTHAGHAAQRIQYVDRHVIADEERIE